MLSCRGWWDACETAFYLHLMSTTTLERGPSHTYIYISFACSFQAKNPEIPQNNFLIFYRNTDSIENISAEKTAATERFY